ncbi:MAG: SDR family oxidoreductase [Acidobacteria bacterium]|nr:SDR family oxidoreductase [Acidobacteriota bacterium]
MNLVVGATGLLGSEICRLLTAEGKPVRALTRSTSDPARLAQLRSLNAEIVQGDLKEPSSLEVACKGVNKIITTASSTLSRQEGDSIQTVDLGGQLNLINAARRTGVSRFVLISFPHAAHEYPLQTAKRAVETHLRNSGLNYTILKPTFFMEVWLSPALGFDAANGKAQIYGTGKNKISWISYKDVAKFAVASVDSVLAENSVIELGGPDALSPLEVVEIFEEVLGRKFELRYSSEEALQEQQKSATDPVQESFAGLMLKCAAGQVIDASDGLERFPMKLTSVRDYAQAGM